MKIRTVALVWLLSALCPLLIASLATTGAHAQSDPVTKLAREKFLEGNDLYDAGKYEEARAAFLQAYALKRHPAVLLNLGLSELKTNHVVEGGNHLQQFKREYAQAKPAQKKSADDGIAEAQQRTGFAIIIVDTDGARVTIDKNELGTSPLLDPVFLKPGRHTAAATAGGVTRQISFDAKRGSATGVQLNFRSAPSVAPVPTAPAIPTAPPTAAPTYPPPGPLGPPPPPGPGIGMPPGGDRGVTTGRENFFKWFKRKPLAWVSAGFTGVGVIGTIAFGAAAADADGAADDVSATIQNEMKTANNLPANKEPCGPRDQPELDYAYYHSACDKLRDNLSAYDTDIALMTTSLIVGVLAAGGTVAYYFIDSKPRKSGSTEGPRIVGFAPIITETERAFGVVGTF